jgi:aryl-alcohol dehydrogenase-like predicted oxidoreductase
MNTTPISARFQPRRELGRTGFSVTAVGIGDLADRGVPLEECVAVLRRALDAGLNLVDTAPGYENGYSEQIVGAALQGRRENVFLIDKIDNLEQPVAPQIESSLKTLGVTSADLWVFHDVSQLPVWERLAAPGGGMDQLKECIAAGKGQWRGISSHHPAVLKQAIESGLCDVVMFPLGPYVDRRYVEETLPLAHSRQVGTVCFKTFGAGKLLGDTAGYNRPLEARPRGKLSSGGNDVTGDAQLPRLPVADCVHYTMTLDPDVTLLGMSHPNEQDAALTAAAQHTPLDRERMDNIRRAAARAMVGKGPCWWNPE